MIFSRSPEVEDRAVPGDDLINIASGPAVAEPTNCAEALDIVRRHAIELPAPCSKAAAT